MLSLLHLTKDTTLLGTLEVYDVDQPWFLCKFEPTGEFALYKPLFDKVSEYFDENHIDAVVELDNQIQEFGLKLFDVTNAGIIEDFLLHIQNDRAWFRY